MSKPYLFLLDNTWELRKGINNYAEKNENDKWTKINTKVRYDYKHNKLITFLYYPTETYVILVVTYLGSN